MQRDYTTCPNCGVTLRASNAERHIQLRCPAKVSTTPPVTPRTTSGHLPTAPRPQERPNYGKTYLGNTHLPHFAREHGRFGSYPLHDDYSEESGPDGGGGLSEYMN